MLLADLQRYAWEGAEAQGHHLTLVIMPLREATMVRLALLHTEVQELYDALPENRAEELADILIRIGDMTHALGITLPGKIAYGASIVGLLLFIDAECLQFHNRIAYLTQQVKRHGIEVLLRNGVLSGFSCGFISQIEQLAQVWKIDIAAAVQAKLAKNMQRPYQFGTPWEAGK